MDTQHIESTQASDSHGDALVYLLVFVMILISMLTGVFSWGFVVPDLFM